MPDVGTPGDDEEADEERDGGDGEYGDGPVEASADLRSGARGGITAHAAALRVEGERAA